MTHKPLIVIALPHEGDGLLEDMGFEVLYCGVGKINATYHLTRRLLQPNREFSYILNIGSAGSHVYKKGELVACDCFMQRDMDVTGLGFALGETPYDTTTPATINFPKKFHHLPHGTCITGDSFLQEKMNFSGDIVDMEAYALAKVCFLEKLYFACVKYITDGADGAASDDWQSNVKYAAKAFSTLLKNH